MSNLNNDDNTKELKVVSTSFVENILERITEIQDNRNVALERMSNAIDKLTTAVNNMTDESNNRPTRKEIYELLTIIKHFLLGNDGNKGAISSLKEDILGSESTNISKLQGILIGKDGEITILKECLLGEEGKLTKIYKYIINFIWILGIIGVVTVILLEILRYLNKLSL